ncbi:dihydrodipicolinate synthase family protein [Arthrobacter sp. CAU 1506]|uniref:dihydrodipicolinate synthase family protein n=1 Tax=Arthrobacter sp. CAU 1506 TaxID=2560052 RepID=UPI0010ABB588|nr:dihydrodipicolinate synthase family protein [Arthrobacter sp. CAU 1506]TJY67660.1 dihydrodipicolinate synthase family protein [Arthrobacter sp. CAU 1506]
MNPFRGLIAYPVTPFHHDGSVNFPELHRHVSAVAGSPVDAITVLGSSGNFAYLDRAERREVITAAVEAAKAVRPDVPVCAGVSAVGTRELLQNIDDAAAAGVDGLLVSTVSYYPLTDEEVAAQCVAAARQSPLPMCLYSNPRTTQFSFSLELVAELAAEPTIVAVKESAADAEVFRKRYEHLRRLLPAGSKDFSHGMSGDPLIADAGFAADAWHGGPIAVLPAHYRVLRDALEVGDVEATDAARAALAPLMGYFGTLRPLSNLYGLARAAGIDAGDPRLPLQPLPGSSLRELARLLEGIEAFLPAERATAGE